MINKIVVLALVLMVVTGTSAFAYEFWGVNIGTAYYEGATQLTFDGLSGSGIQYAVGGWKYTRVDNEWLGAFSAPIPGEGWLTSRRSDAQGLFFRSEGDLAKFVVVTTSSQNGQLATELGYDQRKFGPGDLKIDANGKTYGVGMRIDNLLWAQNLSATGAQYQLYGADGRVISMTARDAGTVGSVVENPLWARAGNQDLPSDSDNRFAFFIDGTGHAVGSATVSFADTGLFMNGARVYAYEVSVPWSTLGLSDGSYFSASWRPDCGNDVISADFNNQLMATPVPEPGTMVALAGGLVGLIIKKRR